ncbi:MAG TPA: hypothetical protein VFM55_10265, partial [Micromonosporaceae bacterium]|nr:hypothetical protein [Micromonosporaceae bacterium]
MVKAWSRRAWYVRVGLLVTPLLCGAGVVHAADAVPAVTAAPVWVTPAGTRAPQRAPATPAAPASPAAPLAGPALASVRMVPGRVQVNTPGFWSWALLDRRTNKVVGSRNPTATST